MHLQVQFQEKRIANRSIEVEPIRSISDDLTQGGGSGVGGGLRDNWSHGNANMEETNWNTSQKRLEIVAKVNQNE